MAKMPIGPGGRVLVTDWGDANRADVRREEAAGRLPHAPWSQVKSDLDLLSA